MYFVKYPILNILFEIYDKYQAELFIEYMLWFNYFMFLFIYIYRVYFILFIL
jgi:hypothetical protein